MWSTPVIWEENKDDDELVTIDRLLKRTQPIIVPSVTEGVNSGNMCFKKRIFFKTFATSRRTCRSHLTILSLIQFA